MLRPTIVKERGVISRYITSIEPVLTTWMHDAGRDELPSLMRLAGLGRRHGKLWRASLQGNVGPFTRDIEMLIFPPFLLSTESSGPVTATYPLNGSSPISATTFLLDIIAGGGAGGGGGGGQSSAPGQGGGGGADGGRLVVKFSGGAIDTGTVTVPGPSAGGAGGSGGAGSNGQNGGNTTVSLNSATATLQSKGLPAFTMPAPVGGQYAGGQGGAGGNAVLQYDKSVSPSFFLELGGLNQGAYANDSQILSDSVGTGGYGVNSEYLNFSGRGLWTRSTTGVSGGANTGSGTAGSDGSDAYVNVPSGSIFGRGAGAGGGGGGSGTTPGAGGPGGQGGPGLVIMLVVA